MGSFSEGMQHCDSEKSMGKLKLLLMKKYKENWYVVMKKYIQYYYVFMMN